MSKLLRLLSVALLAMAAFTSSPAFAYREFNPYSLPTCFSGLPTAWAPDPSWQYSHLCNIGTTVWIVYIDSTEQWYLVRTSVPD
jgi:hypothetical protein